MSTLEHLYPERVFYYFKQIAAIPHGSGNTKAISDYLVKFAKEHALTWYQDEANNVVLVKEASKGYEKAPAIIIQGHMDMVCEKEKDCNLDMDKEGLRLYVDGDFLKAEGTTLGGDDGIAVAYALAILESDEISHPKLEVVITVDEEIGMLGAAVMDLSMLTGHTMLNIDSDEEGIFLTGCAGGMALNVSIPVTRVRQTGKKLSLIVTGLSGGHSGSEIDKEHGNADLLMGRLLYGIFSRSPFGILTLHGGLKDNAIPRECEAEILIPAENTQIVCEYVKELNQEIFLQDAFSYGGALNQNQANEDQVMKRMQKKIDAGLSWFMTQPIYSDEEVEKLGRMKQELNTKILCGIMPLVSYRNAMFIKNEMPGIQVPDEIVEQYRPDMSRGEAEDVAVRISLSVMEKLENIADGFYFMTPFNRVSLICRIIDARK